MRKSDYSEYLAELAEHMFPNDWTGQGRVTWAVYGEGLDLTGERGRDTAAICFHLSNQATLERRNNIGTGKAGVA